MNAQQAPDAMQDWINKGERMMALLEGGSLGISAAFQIGRWWAERPWGELARKRDEAMAQRDELLAESSALVEKLRGMAMHPSHYARLESAIAKATGSA